MSGLLKSLDIFSGVFPMFNRSEDYHAALIGLFAAPVGLMAAVAASAVIIRVDFAGAACGMLG
jgi:hypothetical protein